MCALRLTTIMPHWMSYAAGTGSIVRLTPLNIQRANSMRQHDLCALRMHDVMSDHAASPVGITPVEPRASTAHIHRARGHKQRGAPDSTRRAAATSPPLTAYRPITNASASPIRTRHARSLCSAPTNTRLMKFLPSTYPAARITESARS